MGYKRGVVVVDRGRGVEQHSPQVLLDVADAGCVLPQAVHDKADMFTAQFHKLGFHQLGGVVVPGDADSLSGGADGFQHQVYDLVKLFPVNTPVLNEIVVLDVLQNDFPINLYGFVLSRSFLFRRRSRCLRRGRGQGEERNGMESVLRSSVIIFSLLGK